MSFTINYKNYRGEISTRTIDPHKSTRGGLWFGESAFHKDGPQWFINAYDSEKGAERDFAVKDMIGEARYAALAHLIEHEADVNQRDVLPVGHLILEQAENIEGGTVTQTVRRLNGTEYHRIVDADEAYSLNSREHTMVMDTTGTMICVGDVIRMPIKEPFSELHGDWGEYAVEKSPGGYRLNYLCSAKGQVLPRGYTGGFMSDFILEDGDASTKHVLTAIVPVRSTRMTIQNQLGGQMMAEPKYNISITLEGVQLPPEFLMALQEYLQGRAQLSVDEFKLEVERHVLAEKKCWLKQTWEGRCQNFQKIEIAERMGDK